MDPITTTAQALAAINSTDWLGIMRLIPGLALSALLAWLLATPVQAAIETAIASALPVWAFPLKALLPSIFSAAVGYAAHALGGLSGVDAVTGAVVLAQATHWANEQPWAVSLEGKFPKIWAWIGKGTPPTAKMIMLCGLLLGLGAGSLAAANAYDLSVGAPAGSSVWRFTDGGKLVSDGSAVAGMGLVLSEGTSDTTGAYTPHIALIAGVGGETVGGANYADGFLGLGPIIPGINIPVLAAANWRVGTGQQPAIMLATSVNCNLTLWHQVK
jgi:hypothetical protein